MTHLLTKSWSVLVPALFLCVSLPASEAPAGPEVWEQLVREAYAHSPELQAAHARWAAAAERPAQVGSLPDPTVGYGAFIQRMNTRQRFTVEQMIPGGGRRGLAAEGATRAAAATAAALETTAARVRVEVLMAVADWVLVRQTHALVAENLDLVRALETVAHQRYRAGDAPQADVLRLQSEAALLQADLAEWDERRAPVLARLNTRLGRAGDTPADPVVAGLTTLPAMPALDAGAGHEAALAVLLASHPSLRVSEQRIRQAETQRDLAGRATRPDFMVGLEFMDNRGPTRDELMGMVSVNLPVWREERLNRPTSMTGRPTIQKETTDGPRCTPI